MEARFTADAEHAALVANIAAQVRGYADKAAAAGEPRSKLAIRKKARGHSTHDDTWRKACDPVDLPATGRILHVDTEAREAVVEGQVTMGHLCSALLPMGFVPLVVPEFPTFTVAGLINGLGVQSSCHKFGGFYASISAVEVVTASGGVVVATPSNAHASLYRAIHGSYGTLGFVVGAVIAIRPAKPFVRTTYHWHTDVDAFVEHMKSRLGKPDFLEGVAYAPDSLVVIDCQFADADEVLGLPKFEPGAGLDDHMGEEWYYQYVAKTKTRGIVADAIPTLQYLHRSARGMYWSVEYFVGSRLLTSSRRFRKYVDRKVWQVHAEHGLAVSYMTPEEADRTLVHQDLLPYMSQLGDMLRFARRTVAVYPIWVCPVKLSPLQMTFMPPSRSGAFPDDTHTVDFGVYGEPQVRDFRVKRDVQALQRAAGYTSTWGNLYLSRAEFESMYDMAPYWECRRTYGADGCLPDLFDKVTLVEPYKEGDDPGPGPVPAFRLVRLYRERPVASCVAAAAVVATVAAAAAATLAVARRRGVGRAAGRSLARLAGVVRSWMGGCDGGKQ